MKTLNQGERQPLSVEDQVVQVYAATNGYLDRINVDRVEEFLRGLTERMHSEGGDVLGKIAEGDWSDETQKAVADAVSKFADDFGYDLDEEGLPVDQGDDAGEEKRPARDEDSGDSDGAREGAREEAAVA